MPILNGVARGATGALTTSTAAVTKTSPLVQGLARTVDKVVHIVALGATPVPPTATRTQGIALSTTGALYTTNTAPAVSAVWRNGLAVRADGALHVTSTAGNNLTFDQGLSVVGGRLAIA